MNSTPGSERCRPVLRSAARVSPGFIDLSGLPGSRIPPTCVLR